MKAGEVVFQKLLDGKIQYVVPLYQRTYNWESDQWEQLWDDLLELYALPSSGNHFIGSIVTQQVPDSPESVTRYTLIDGQQRMTTLLLLLSVIKQRAEVDKATWGELADEIQESCLTNKFNSGDQFLKLMPTQSDRAPFRKVVEGAIVPAGSQIAKARDYFAKMLEQGDGNDPQLDLRKLHSCIVNHLDMVSIHLHDDDSPNRIFESLNNTGMSLSVADLVRNYLLMNIPEPEQQERAYHEHWYPMEQTLAKGSGDTAGDFFWRYCMMHGSLLRKDDTYKQIQESISRPTPEKALTALRDFAKFSNYYAQISGLTNEGLVEPLTEGFERLNQWDFTVAYPFLMRAMDSLATGVVGQSDLVEVIRLIESYVVRRTVCGVPTNQLRRIFAQMSGQGDFFTTDLYQKTRNHLLANRWPNDADFVPAFVQFPLYTSSRVRGSRLNLVLWTLERAFGHKESPAQTDQITVEHIMPQSLTDDWRKELGANWAEVHDKWLHTVGNLTLTGYNAPLGNKPFSEKKRDLADSNFALSDSIQNFAGWNEDSIRQRGEELANLALQVWKR